MTAWVRHGIWWQVYPLGFLGAEPRCPADGAGAAHRLEGLEPWLDYLVELGCNGLALGPVFASETHGYDTVDHFRIDPRLGTDADFDKLVGRCRERGVRLLLDGVFNHVGRGFPAFRDVLAHGRDSRFADWFRLDFSADGPDGFGYADFEGHRHLVALNHEEPAVAEHVVAVMRHWLDRGADGWRLDAAYAVPLPFWRTVSDRVRAAHPDVWLVGEVIHGDYPAWTDQGGLDATTQYELWKAVWSSLNDRNFFELAWALERHAAFSARFVPLTFVGNHDVTRLASVLDEPRHLELAVVVLCTVPGVPSVYYGDEQGFHGIKEDREGGDDAVRPAFPADPGGLAPYGWGVHRHHKRLLGLRRRHPWLVDARIEVVHLANEQIAYRATALDGSDSLIVLLNTAGEPRRMPVPEGTVVLAADGHGGDPAEAPGHGWTVIRPH
ncbi:alpha-amylase family protein [Allonocardiopsis opalescens]|uniref:Cyclomaltodextrinase n=1 Tax=Allonocardiopsis opalescens TaxID=1144618 RepID=A0A2T0Q2C5_9ACTN|nr:alpha-amylase family protein [Allonocardiopsis opalescens]PRX97945.1 cyclomaltodextrinase [Allonocardiopsis opalescens]